MSKKADKAVKPIGIQAILRLLIVLLRLISVAHYGPSSPISSLLASRGQFWVLFSHSHSFVGLHCETKGWIEVDLKPDLNRILVQSSQI